MPESEYFNYLKLLYKKQVSQLTPFYSLMIALTDGCNLNCTNCQTFCRINSTPKFTTLQEIKQYLPFLKEKLNYCKDIKLFGGEPLLNPEIKEICQYLRQEYPSLQISIFTNGLLLSTWTEEDFAVIKKLNIDFLITVYPIKKSVENIKLYEKKFQEMGIKMTTHGVRPYFNKSTYDKKGRQNILQRYFHCFHSKIPFSFYLHKNKLFKCGVCANYPNFGIPQSEKDYILIDQATKEEIIDYLSTPLNACKYCGAYRTEYNSEQEDPYGSDELIIWHQQKDLPSDYEMSLQELYTYKYDIYYKYCHDCKHILPFLKDEYFLSKIDMVQEMMYDKNYIQVYLDRFFEGKCDIYIPFDKTIIENIDLLLMFRQLIFKQKKCNHINFYFVSTDKDQESKYKMYRYFTPTSCDVNINTYFLEGEDGYSTFLQNSFLKNKYTLKINQNTVNQLQSDDYFISKIIGKE